MMNNKCLVCNNAVDAGSEYHPACSRDFFGVFPPPSLEFSLEDIYARAAESVLSRITVTGVQKKLSLSVEATGKDRRFTIVGLWGSYILKPPVDEYESLPENENMMMRLASSLGIPVVRQALIRLASGELSYICKRVDREANGQKLAMEDFCQISGKMTEDKYRGSVEHVGKLLRKYSVYPGLDAVDLLERVLFNFACGNADMHLKNYSLLETSEGMRLSPAYDLVSTVLAIPDDPEETALTINGKKRNLTKKDFLSLGENLGISETVIRRLLAKICQNRQAMKEISSQSYLSAHLHQQFCALIDHRLDVLAE